jgi:ComF family protein
MCGVRGVLQAVADFLVDERCHACRDLSAPRPAPALPVHPAVVVLDEPVGTIGIARWRIRTRLLCRRCLSRLEPCVRPVVVGRGRDTLEVLPAFLTDSRLLALVHLLKFARRECVAPWLARAVAEGLPAGARGAGVLLVPVPMDPVSRRLRGFNQAESIAREIGRRWGLPVVTDALVKPAPTAAQSLLGREARERNLAGAFLCGRGAARLSGRRVVLVDDLVTTGATARACARVLRTAGAARVRVVCAGYRP